MLAKTAAKAPAAKIHFEGIRIMPTPLFDADRRQRKRLALNLSWFKQSGKPRGAPGRGAFEAKDVW
jgi:hypothetical protein